MADVAEGQRLVIYAIVLYIAAAVVRVAFGDLWALFGLAAIIVAVVGLIRLSRGLGYSTVMTALLLILMILPLISIVTLAIVNARATEALRAGGYKVGFFGVRR